jgi:hypothetical protein
LKSKKDISLFCDTVAASDKFISSCKKPFMDMMGTKAEKVSWTRIFVVNLVSVFLDFHGV